MRASISIGFTCNGATPIAIVSATSPSILAVDLRLLGLRLPASSSAITVWLTHIESTGWLAVREISLEKDLFQVSECRAHARNALAEFDETSLTSCSLKPALSNH